MPGVVLEEPFSIARFHNVIDSSDISKQFTIGLNPLDHSIVATENDETVDDSDLVLVSVQGEGIKLYNVNKTSFFLSYIYNDYILRSDGLKTNNIRNGN